jgi:hypothetical protein
MEGVDVGVDAATGGVVAAGNFVAIGAAEVGEHQDVDCLANVVEHHHVIEESER